MVTRLKAQPCPTCGKNLDAVTVMTNENVKPRPDDFTICIYCQTPLVFTKDLTVRPATLAEKHEFAVALRHWVAQTLH